MSLDGLPNSLRFYADVGLCGCGAGVLEKVLHSGNVISAVLVDFCGVPIAETVGLMT